METITLVACLAGGQALVNGRVWDPSPGLRELWEMTVGSDLGGKAPLGPTQTLTGDPPSGPTRSLVGSKTHPGTK